MKQITPEQHLIASYTPLIHQFTDPKTGEVSYYEYKRFTKPGESQAKAIKRLMSSLHSAANKQPVRNFHVFTQGITTADYVRKFENLNKLRHTDSPTRLDRAAPVNEGPEITFSTVGDECLDPI